jgi:hypothetical protein
MIKCPSCGYNNEDVAPKCVECQAALKPTVMAMSSATMEADDNLEKTARVDHIPKFELLSALDSAPVPEVTLPSALIFPEGVPESPATAPALTPQAIVVDSKPHLVVLRGEKIDMQYPIYPGKNFIGRTDEKPVDIDLECQERADQIWTSRQHAVITFEHDLMTIEDLNSLNGTFVNRARVHPGQLRTLQVNDIIQCGTVQMRVVLD